jgi:hypothetical protein
MSIQVIIAATDNATAVDLASLSARVSATELASALDALSVTAVGDVIDGTARNYTPNGPNASASNPGYPKASAGSVTGAAASPYILTGPTAKGL